MNTNTNININMEYILNSIWWLINSTLLTVGLISKDLFNNASNIKEELGIVALILGLISTVVFIGFNIAKWHYQILKTRQFKKINK